MLSRNYHATEMASTHETLASWSILAQDRIEGVSTVHTLRHTFALTMDDLGARTSSIQERLGYESLLDVALPQPLTC
jgi:site-specific recombinase XerD